MRKLIDRDAQHVYAADIIDIISRREYLSLMAITDLHIPGTQDVPKKHLGNHRVRHWAKGRTMQNGPVS